jgi:hypothetical protein
MADAAECDKVTEMGEVAYNRMKMEDTRRWIASHPGTFLAR